MNRSDIIRIRKKAVRDIKKHSPKILTALGICSMISSTVLAVKATPKAVELIESDSRECHDGDPHGYTLTEAISSSWKCYIPAAMTGSIAIACFIGANSISSTRSAALGAAYALSETAFKEYREKVQETIGEKKEKAIKDSICKERMQECPPKQCEIIATGRGNTLCFDVLSGRYFYSDIGKLRKAENELNRRMRDELYISINEFFEELGLDDIKIGDDLGWEIDRGYIDLHFSSQLNENDVPCLVIGHSQPPVYFG